MDETILGAFSVDVSGNVGQVIRGPDGKIVAWTTDLRVAQVIERVLTDNQELLNKENMKCD